MLQNMFEHWFNYGFYKTTGFDWFKDNLKNYYVFWFQHPDKPCRLGSDQTHSKNMSHITDLFRPCYEFFGSLGAYNKGTTVRSEVEINTDLPFPRTSMTGKVDFLITLADGKTIIVDLKASTVNSKFLDKTQLLFYNYLLKANTGKMATDSHIFAAKSGESAFDLVLQEEVILLEKDLTEASKAIFSGLKEEVAKDQSLCYNCSFKTNCWVKHKLMPSGKEENF